jgi:hypothetical protein
MNASQSGNTTSRTGYPKAHLPQLAQSGEAVKPCYHCGQPLALQKWDSWNGFLVECPHCHGLHGKSWNIKRVLLASFVFSAFSFLFTMPLKRAVVAILGFALFAFVGNYLIDHSLIPDIAGLAGGVVFMLGPMLINAILLVKHEHDFDQSPNQVKAYSRA